MNADFIKQFEKQFGKGVLKSASEIEKPTYRGTGSIALDIALGGGWGRGRVVQLQGKEGSGKTLLFDMAAIEAQRVENKKSLIFDFEGTYDTKRFASLGGDLDMLTIITHENVEPMLLLDIAFDIEKSILINTEEYACIGFDSTGACITLAQYEKKLEEGQAAHTPFGVAKVMADGLCITCGLVARNPAKPTVFFVSQGRANVDGRSFRGMPVPDNQTGGRALPYYASQRVEVSRGDTYKGDVEDLGLKDIEVGHVTKVKIKKNKLNGNQGRVAQFDVYNEGEFVGLDRVSELASLGVYARVIEKSGSWYVVGGERVQGLDSLKDALRADDKLYSETYTRTKQALSAMMDASAEPADDED